MMRHRPRHSPTAGPCRHGPDSNRALPCLVRAIESKPRALGQRTNCIFATRLNRYCEYAIKKIAIANLPLKMI
uniref:Uncharacterized protein n=1 Tax=Oryza sativa subsp. japonica TaxID=39947 RepID=Q8H5C6_ORYSJ|nr:hypothetical protein [Oryza sativa Japonica Group]BAD31471.1 hypothetical protein [Oryza sativa Japonica Group]